MSFAAKEDYVGLASAGLVLRSNGQNASSTVLEIPGSDGSVLGDEVTGHVKAPTCGYAISAATTLSGLQLGKVHGSAGPFALSRIRVSTGAGQEPEVEADSVQIEPGAARTVCVYGVDPVSVSPARHAQTFGAFSYTESLSCALQGCDFEAAATIDPATVNNEPVASDATGGRETVAATFWTSTETAAPAATPAAGWHVTTDWTCTGADASMFVWTATFTKYLSAS